MANTNLQSTGISMGDYGQGKKYTVSLVDLKLIGAATSGNVVLDSLPAGAIITLGRIKHSTALAGGSVSAATARVTTAANSFGAAAFDVFQAVSNTALQNFGTTTVTPVGELWAVATPVNLAIALTGDNAVNLTAGQIDVFIRYTILK